MQQFRPMRMVVVVLTEQSLPHGTHKQLLICMDQQSGKSYSDMA